MPSPRWYQGGGVPSTAAQLCHGRQRSERSSHQTLPCSKVYCKNPTAAAAFFRGATAVIDTARPTGLRPEPASKPVGSVPACPQRQPGSSREENMHEATHIQTPISHPGKPILPLPHLAAQTFWCTFSSMDTAGWCSPPSCFSTAAADCWLNLSSSKTVGARCQSRVSVPPAISCCATYGRQAPPGCARTSRGRRRTGKRSRRRSSRSRWRRTSSRWP